MNSTGNHIKAGMNPIGSHIMAGMNPAGSHIKAEPGRIGDEYGVSDIQTK